LISISVTIVIPYYAFILELTVAVPRLMCYHTKKKNQC